MKRCAWVQGKRGRCKGWARIIFHSHTSATAALTSVGASITLHNDHVAQLSHACGRCDTLFPKLPCAVRCRLKVDSVGAFSVTDQFAADAMTDILAAVAAAMKSAAAECSAPWQPSVAHPSSAAANSSASSTFREEDLNSNTAGGACWPSGGAAAYCRTAAAGAGALLPLTVTDATACCGGNTLSFMQRFARIHAVEVDEDRCCYLKQNVETLRRWQQGQLGQQQPLAAAADHCRNRSDANGANGKSGGDTLPQAADSRATGCGTGFSTTAAGSNAAAGGEATTEPGLNMASGSDASVQMYCGSYNTIWPKLWQDVVFIDPPWGGPQYNAQQHQNQRRQQQQQQQHQYRRRQDRRRQPRQGVYLAEEETIPVGSDVDQCGEMMTEGKQQQGMQRREVEEAQGQNLGKEVACVSPPLLPPPPQQQHQDGDTSGDSQSSTSSSAAVATNTSVQKPNDLDLGGVSVAHLCAQLLANGACQLCALKLPRSMDLASFVGRIHTSMKSCSNRATTEGYLGTNLNPPSQPNRKNHADLISGEEDRFQASPACSVGAAEDGAADNHCGGSRAHGLLLCCQIRFGGTWLLLLAPHAAGLRDSQIECIQGAALCALAEWRRSNPENDVHHILG